MKKNRTSVMFFAAAATLIAIFAMGLSIENKAVGQESVNPFGQNKKAKVRPKKRVARTEKPTFSDRTLQNERTRKQLDKTVDLIYDAEPFGDLRARLSQDLGINIVVDANLDGVLDDETEVSANLTGVNLAGGLRTLLKAVDATFVIKDGVLLIISIDDEMEPDYLTRHLIDVRELLRLIRVVEADRIGKPIASVKKPVLDVAQADDDVDPEAEMQPLSIPLDASEGRELLTAEKILTDMITRFIASEAWRENGFGNCDLMCVGDILILYSSELVSFEVRDFLQDFEFLIKNPK